MRWLFGRGRSKLDLTETEVIYHKSCMYVNKVDCFLFLLFYQTVDVDFPPY